MPLIVGNIYDNVFGPLPPIYADSRIIPVAQLCNKDDFLQPSLRPERFQHRNIPKFCYLAATMRSDEGMAEGMGGVFFVESGGIDKGRSEGDGNGNRRWWLGGAQPRVARTLR